MIELFPAIDPYARGALDVGDGQTIAWDIAGNPAGAPAVGVHGGPGPGSSPNLRRTFDPTRYRVVLFDQRGCGRSTPHASHPETAMDANTTWHLVADIERLREHLGIDRWLVCGGSWGSTLALAYAEKHPERVTAIVLVSVTTSRRVESEWLYRGLRRFFPEAWERFRAHVEDDDVIAAYARRMNDPAHEVRLAAARAWCAWEDAALGLEQSGADLYSNVPETDLVAMVRICTHYAAHGAWLEEGVLVRGATRLAGIPGVLIHGRRDLTCPIDTAYDLARAWPDASLVPLEESGHLRSDEKRAAVLAAIARFA